MNVYRAAEKTLAILLGWTDIADKSMSFFWFGRKTPEGPVECVPAWARDNMMALALMSQYSINVAFDGDDMVCVNWEDGSGEWLGHAHDVPDHESKEATVRFAIINAVISLLEDKAAKPYLTNGAYQWQQVSTK